MHIANANPYFVVDETDQAANAKKWIIQGNAGLLRFGASNDVLDTTTYGLNLDRNGNVGIGTTNPEEVLTVTGNVSISGTNCKDSASGPCSNFVDIAELFPASEPVESGDVVSVDFINKGKIKKSQKQYEKAIVGIVS